MAGHPPRGRPRATPAACSPHRACRPRGQCWAPTPTHPRPQHVVCGPQQPAPVGGQSGEGQRLASDAPHSDGRHPPGTPFRRPHSEQRQPARAHAVGPVLGPHAGTDRTWDTRVAEPWLPAPQDGRPGDGQRLTPGAPRNSGRPPPPGTAPHHPRSTQPPQGMQARGLVLGPRTHTPAPTARWWRTPTARPKGGQSGEGQRLTPDAPHTMVEGAPPGDTLPPPPQRATPARKGARCGAGVGPHTRADRIRDTRVAEPRLPFPEDGRAGEGQRLTPDAPRNDGKHPPRGRPSATPTTSNAPTHHRTSHGTSAPRPLLLGTATQQWRNPRPHAKHAPDL